MVARTSKEQRKALAPLDPSVIRETVKKVDKCMARLQELQDIVVGTTIDSRSSRGPIRANLRCKQDSLKLKNSPSRKSPVGKFSTTATGEWKRMSLPAMLVGETVGEILHASQFTKKVIAAVTTNVIDDPKTPLIRPRRRERQTPEASGMKSRRKVEKQDKLQSIRSESGNSSNPRLRRARSRIVFRVSPAKKRDEYDDIAKHPINRVSPKTKPWTKKAVLFPNPLFQPIDSSQQMKFSKTRSPVIARSKPNTPHKFLIKSPNPVSKFQMKVKSPPRISALSPNRKRAETPKASKLRRSLSPSRLAARLVSPLRSIKNVQRGGDSFMNSMKHRPILLTPRRVPLVQM